MEYTAAPSIELTEGQIRHRLDAAAEEKRTAYLVGDDDRFIGRISAIDRQIYRITSLAGAWREFGLGDVRQMHLVNSGYARIELFHNVCTKRSAPAS